MALPQGRSGFSIVEIMFATSIFSLAIVIVFNLLSIAQKDMKSESARYAIQGGATSFLDRMGRDARESSYAYIFAGDWLASNSGGLVSVLVARNYLSASPSTSGNILAPGISDEGFAQCPNPACQWCCFDPGTGPQPSYPKAFLTRQIRNNPQSGVPSLPPSGTLLSALDWKGRLYSNRRPGEACPYCGAALEAEAFLGGLMLFSPRKADNSFSYGGPDGLHAQWESMVFYCPFRNQNGLSEIRRYVFHAESLAVVGPAPSLVDLLDFDGDGIVQSPPMTGENGAFVLDADGEAFCLVNRAPGSNVLMYTRWSATAGRTFRIEVDRATGMADVNAAGGAFATGGTVQVRCRMQRWADGLSDFDASTFENNPSFYSGGTDFNPSGVSERGVLRVTFQMDKAGPQWSGSVETVQTTMMRPRN